MPPKKFETVGPDGSGRRKHKTPDNITHPFPDYPFEKLFCRIALSLSLFLPPSLSPSLSLCLSLSLSLSLSLLTYGLA